MKKLIGKNGELEAAEYLLREGYQILFRNFRSRFGEIDIIAYDKNEKSVVFIEVRTKSNEKFGTAEESVTKTKKQRLYKTALYYLSRYPVESYRFDLIAINLFKESNLKHYKNILG